MTRSDSVLNQLNTAVMERFVSNFWQNGLELLMLCESVIMMPKTKSCLFIIPAFYGV